MKIIFILSVFFFSAATFSADTRIKDLITIKGVRDNPIIGYGLVIGLNGTGDGGGEITDTSLKKMFQKLGLNPQKEISSKNVAAVIVTANISSFAKTGQKIDVLVSSIGDAKSLAGGSLLVTPLKGGDGQVYSIASGPVSIGGLKQGAKFATTGSIPSGATVEKEIISDFEKKQSLRLSVNNPDFTTTARIEKILNEELGGKFAIAKDSATIDLIVPVNYQRNLVQLISIIENFKVNADQAAKIVINERTGTVVVGGEIVLKPVAISHGELTIEISGEGGGSGGKKKGDSLIFLDKKATLNDLVKGLNSMGATPEDLISIFQALKRDGALNAEIEMI